LRELLKERAKMHHIFRGTRKSCDLQLSDDIIEDIKIRLCCVAQEPQGDDAGTLMRYPISSEQVLEIDTFTRERAAEVLFEGDEEDVSIATVILDSLTQCPCDARCLLAQNILLIGGTVLLKGFKARLLHTLEKTIQSGTYSMLRGLAGEFGLASSPFPVNYLAWLGGSIVGCVEHQEAITIKQYKGQKALLPDWTRIHDNTTKEPKKDRQPPKGPFELTPAPLSSASSPRTLSKYLA